MKYLHMKINQLIYLTLSLILLTCESSKETGSNSSQLEVSENVTERIKSAEGKRLPDSKIDISDSIKQYLPVHSTNDSAKTRFFQLEELYQYENTLFQKLKEDLPSIQYSTEVKGDHYFNSKINKWFYSKGGSELKYFLSNEDGEGGWHFECFAKYFQGSLITQYVREEDYLHSISYYNQVIGSSFVNFEAPDVPLNQLPFQQFGIPKDLKFYNEGPLNIFKIFSKTTFKDIDGMKYAKITEQENNGMTRTSELKLDLELYEIYYNKPVVLEVTESITKYPKRRIELSKDSISIITNRRTKLEEFIKKGQPDSAMMELEVIGPFLSSTEIEYLMRSTIRKGYSGLSISLHDYWDKIGLPHHTKYFLDYVNSYYLNVCKGDLALVKLLIEKLDWRPQTKTDSVFQICNAIEENKVEILNFFLENGWSHLINSKEIPFEETGDADPEDLGFHSPKMSALRKDDFQIIQILKNYGAIFNREDLIEAANGKSYEFLLEELVGIGENKSSLMLASINHTAYFGNYKRLDYLINLVMSNEDLDVITKSSSIFKCLDQQGFPHKSKIEDKFKCFTKLITAGANINQQDELGQSVLMKTTQLWGQYGYEKYNFLDFAVLLIENGASTDLIDQNGEKFWDHIIRKKNKVFMEYFAEQDITPQKYRYQFDSLAPTIDLKTL